MTEYAIRDTTAALKTRLESVLGANNKVYVGAPKRDASFTASLFLINVTPNRDLRNVEHFVPPPGGAAPNSAARPVDAVPVDLRYLITVFHHGDANADPEELVALGRIIRVLHIEPTLAGIEGQEVRVSQEPYTLEDMNRIWGMFPEETYSPSVVYLASPVFIHAELTVGPPVLERSLKQGVPADPLGGSGRQGLAA